MATAAQIRSRRHTRKFAAVLPSGPPLETVTPPQPTELEAHLIELRRENDELRRCLFEAAQVQRRFCGPRQLRRGSFEVASEIFPVRHLSGDFICLFESGEELVFAVGDIEGKGLRAAMWFTHLVSMIRSQFAVDPDPASVVHSINTGFVRAQLGAPLTSLFLGQLNWRRGVLTYCNAGHPPAVILRDRGRSELLSRGGPLLGVVETTTYTNGSVLLESGDVLLAYSDGISECRNLAGVEFGDARVVEVAQQAHGNPASMLFSMLAAVEDFADGRPREDDFAVIVVQRDKVESMAA